MLVVRQIQRCLETLSFYVSVGQNRLESSVSVCWKVCVFGGGIWGMAVVRLWVESFLFFDVNIEVYKF